MNVTSSKLCHQALMVQMQCFIPVCIFKCFNYGILAHFSLLLSALGLPGQVGEVCPLIPNLEKSLEEIMELAESGMRYTQMPHVMEVGYRANFIHPHFCCAHIM